LYGLKNQLESDSYQWNVYWICCLYFTVTYFFIYFYLPLTLKEIYLKIYERDISKTYMKDIYKKDIHITAYSYIYFIVKINLNRWIMRLKIVVEYERMFWFKVLNLFWLQKQMSLNIGTLFWRMCEYQRTQIVLWTLLMPLKIDTVVTKLLDSQA
jgi:hypothetical protein